MSDLGFGLWITALGMGSVFLLLALLMLLLRAIGWWDQRAQRQPSAPDARPPVIAPVAGDWPTGLGDEEVAAICIAVITHARNRRLQAAPETRSAVPGTQLFASRWVGVGRGQQNRQWRRGN
ncbi:MAG: OadG family transporter subunit [Candidatus Nanopelagicales bacterium]